MSKRQDTTGWVEAILAQGKPSQQAYNNAMRYMEEQAAIASEFGFAAEAGKDLVEVDGFKDYRLDPNFDPESEREAERVCVERY